MDRRDAIKRFIVAEFAPDISTADLADDYDLIDGGVVDSLGLLKVIGWLESEFGVPIDDVELAPENFRSVTEINEFVARHVTNERV